MILAALGLTLGADVSKLEFWVNCLQPLVVTNAIHVICAGMQISDRVYSRDRNSLPIGNHFTAESHAA